MYKICKNCTNVQENNYQNADWNGWCTAYSLDIDTDLYISMIGSQNA